MKATYRWWAYVSRPGENGVKQIWCHMFMFHNGASIFWSTTRLFVCLRRMDECPCQDLSLSWRRDHEGYIPLMSLCVKSREKWGQVYLMLYVHVSKLGKHLGIVHLYLHKLFFDFVWTYSMFIVWMTLSGFKMIFLALIDHTEFF